MLQVTSKCLMRYLSLLTLMISTTLILMSVLHTTKHAHISSNVAKTVDKQHNVLAPLEANPLASHSIHTQDFTTLASKPALAGKEAMTTLPHTLQSRQHSNNAYIQALESVASTDRSILLSLVDHAYAPVAVNFFLTSIKPFGIHNYMILTMSPETCTFIRTYGVMNCFQYLHFASSSVSTYGSKAFKDKMNVRTDMILEALEANLTVLHSDTDVIFFQNPFQTIKCPVQSCDIAALMDTVIYNAGFLLVHPTEQSKNVYTIMKQMVTENTWLDDQNQFNTVVKAERLKGKQLYIRPLPRESYVCGLYYYTRHNRYFADTAHPCPTCIVVHNNWIFGMAAKVYRAKELHHWMYDEDKYYTSLTRKYLTYENIVAQEESHSNQLTVLKAALAFSIILNRTLILPKFQCRSEKSGKLEDVL